MKSLIIVYFLTFFITGGLFTQSDILTNEALLNTGNLLNNISSADIYQKCSDAIVMINNYDHNNVLQKYGSGVIVSQEGLIYTNYHVVDISCRIEVRNGNTVYDSIPIAGFDPFSDAAILKLPEGSYPYINIVKESNLRVGNSIFALGNPQGYTKTISYGIISAFRSNILQDNIQFTAPIAPGSSGGALLNTAGELIGITSSCVETGQNMNFAVPISKFIAIPVINVNNHYQKNDFDDLVVLYQTNYNISWAADIISKYIHLFKDENAKWEFAGKLYHKLGMYDSSINCFTRAIELNSQEQMLYKLRGDAYSKSGDSVKTLEDYEMSLFLSRDCIYTYLARADYYHYDLRNYEKALEDYDMVLKINPEYDYVYTLKADCRIVINDKEGAIRELSNSLKWKNDNPDMYVRRAQIYEIMDMYDEAIEDYSNALFYSPRQYDYYLERAILYSKLNEHEKAIGDYLEFLKYEPHNSTAYNNLAYAYMNVNQYENAEKYFTSSIKYDKRHFDSYLGLSILNYRQGKFKATIKYMCQAIEIENFLNYGMNGIAELEKRSWFWDKKEKNDFKRIFRIMGVTDTKIEEVEYKEPESRRVKREAAERNK